MKDLDSRSAALILTNLPLRDLASLARVSRLWNSWTRPILARALQQQSAAVAATSVVAPLAITSDFNHNRHQSPETEFIIFSVNPRDNEQQARDELQKFLNKRRGRKVAFARAMSLPWPMMRAFLEHGGPCWCPGHRALQQFYDYTVATRIAALKFHSDPSRSASYSNPLTFFRQYQRGRFKFAQWTRTPEAIDLLEPFMDVIAAIWIDDARRSVLIVELNASKSHVEIQERFSDQVQEDHIRFADKGKLSFLYKSPPRFVSSFVSSVVASDESENSSRSLTPDTNSTPAPPCLIPGCLLDCDLNTRGTIGRQD